MGLTVLNVDSVSYYCLQRTKSLALVSVFWCEKCIHTDQQWR